METDGETGGGMASEWTSEWLRAFLLKILGTAIGFVMAWPYVLKLVCSVKEALNRTTTQERERAAALRALQERQSALGTPDRNRARDSAGGGPGSGAGQRTVLQPRPPQERAAGAEQPLQQPESLPLTTLEELLAYEGPGWAHGFAPARPLPFVAAPFPPLKSRLLVCHDLAGGYGEDRFVQGGGYDRAYRMYDWGLIDVFVYFSHNLVTIPPAGWIDVAHRHGTRVLGTFITEWEKGCGICEEFLKSEATADRVAEKLARIAMDHGFDGWLINVENKVCPGESVDVLVHFVKSLTARMRAATAGGAPYSAVDDEAEAAASENEDQEESSSRPSSPPSSPAGEDVAGGGGGGGGGDGGDGDGGGVVGSAARAAHGSMVLWYDSVTVNGELDWQDRLNGKNRVFFDACDGIFSNYCWKADYPSACALEASARRFDVYMGIDTFGRGTWGGGGFDVDKAMGKIRRAGVSAALFAPAWTMENQTTGGGRVDPKKGGWTETEQEFGDIDAEFWSKIGAAWQPPRNVPGGVPGGAGRGAPPLLPLLVNFGHGVGSSWRIQGEEVAEFGGVSRVAAGGGGVEDPAEGRLRPVVGGAFFDLSSQCLTPLVGGRGGATVGRDGGRLRSDVVQARRAGAGSVAASQGGANGTVGVSYSFGESYDGGSSLRLTGVLNEKATAVFPLYSCDVPLPAEPLEVRLTFCGNPESEVALVLSLDVPGQLGGRREVVLRDWGREGAPEKQGVFSKRLTFAEHKSTYCPVREDLGREVSSASAPSAEDSLQARVRALRDAGEAYDSIWTRLRAERSGKKGGSGGGGGGGGSGKGAGVGGSSGSSSCCWITRTYVVRDLRMGGSRAIREVSLVCARRKPPAVAVAAAAGPSSSPSPSSTSPSLNSAIPLEGGHRLGDGDGAERAGSALRGVAGLAAYRAFLGEIAVGPWRRETPSTFGKMEGLRAEDVTCFQASGEEGGGDDDSGPATACGSAAAVVVDLSLAWESEGIAGSSCNDGVLFGAGSPWATAHCDVWQASEEEEGGWRWLGRAYGRKYRLMGLRVGSGSGGGRKGEGGGEGPVVAAVLAVQQVNAMGYRQPVEDWARLQLYLP